MQDRTALSVAVTVTLDVTGLPCPIPVLKTQKALATLAAGAVIEVLGSDPASDADMQALCKATGNDLIVSDVSHPGSGTQPVYRFLIRKRAAR